MWKLIFAERRLHLLTGDEGECIVFVGNNTTGQMSHIML